MGSAPRESRKSSLVRDGWVAVAIAAGLFLVVEVALRLFWPQLVTTTVLAGGSISVPDPIVGPVHTPNSVVRIWGPEFDDIYRVNEHGLRDESNHPTPARPGVSRVMIVGSSYTLGYGVEYEESFPVLFEQGLRAAGYDVDVVKAGATNLNTRTKALNLERLFPRFGPDIVVFVFVATDLYSNTPLGDTVAAGEAITEMEPGETTSTQRGLHALRLAKRMVAATDYLYTRAFLLTPRRSYFTAPVATNPLLAEQLVVTDDLVKGAAEYVRERGARFAVLSLPIQFQVLYGARGYTSDSIAVSVIDHYLAPAAAAADIPWFTTLSDLTAEYRATGVDLFFRFDGHLTVRGNVVVAESFQRQFLERFGSELTQSAAAAPSSMSGR